MGMGFNTENATPGADYSPYIQIENIDTRWLAFIQNSSVKEAEASKAAALKANGRLKEEERP